MLVWSVRLVTGVGQRRSSQNAHSKDPQPLWQGAQIPAQASGGPPGASADQEGLGRAHPGAVATFTFDLLPHWGPQAGTLGRLALPHALPLPLATWAEEQEWEPGFSGTCHFCCILLAEASHMARLAKEGSPPDGHMARGLEAGG